MRPLLALALTCILAGVGSAGVPPPTPTVEVWLFDTADLSCHPGFFPKDGWKGVLGTSLTWYNGSSARRTVTETSGFWQWTMSVGTERTRRMSSAGTYKQHCAPGGLLHTVPVRLKGPIAPPENSFVLTWATDAAPDSYRYTVAYRIGDGAWQTWRNGASARSGKFAGTEGTTYVFRARTSNGTGVSGWSPGKKVVT